MHEKVQAIEASQGAPAALPTSACGNSNDNAMEAAPAPAPADAAPGSGSEGASSAAAAPASPAASSASSAASGASSGLGGRMGAPAGPQQAAMMDALEHQVAALLSEKTAAARAAAQAAREVKALRERVQFLETARMAEFDCDEASPPKGASVYGTPSGDLSGVGGALCGLTPPSFGIFMSSAATTPASALTPGAAVEGASPEEFAGPLPTAAQLGRDPAAVAAAMRSAAALVTPAKGLVLSPGDDNVRMAGPTALAAVAAAFATSAAVEAAAEALSTPPAPDFAFGTPVAALALAATPSAGSSPSFGDAAHTFSFVSGSSGGALADEASTDGFKPPSRGRRIRRRGSSENTPVNIRPAPQPNSTIAPAQQEEAAQQDCSWAGVVAALASKSAASPSLMRAGSFDPMAAAAAGKRRKAAMPTTPEGNAAESGRQRRPLTPVGANGRGRAPAAASPAGGFR